MDIVVSWMPAVLALVGGGLLVGALRASPRRESLIAPGLAALVAGVLGLAGAPPLAQLLVLAVGAVGGSVLGWRWRSLLDEGSTLPPGAGAVRLIGMSAMVMTDVPPGDPAADPDEHPGVVPGRVRVAGETWRAETTAAAPLPADTTVTVTEVRGTRLVVVPVDAASDDDPDDGPGQPGDRAPTADPRARPDPTPDGTARSDATPDGTVDPDPAVPSD